MLFLGCSVLGRTVMLSAGSSWYSTFRPEHQTKLSHSYADRMSNSKDEVHKGHSSQIFSLPLQDPLFVQACVNGCKWAEVSCNPDTVLSALSSPPQATLKAGRYPTSGPFFWSKVIFYEYKYKVWACREAGRVCYYHYDWTQR